MCFLGEGCEGMQKIKFWNIWERPLCGIWEYAFNNAPAS